MYDGEKMYSAELERLLGPSRRHQEPIEERHRNIAASLQAVTEDAMVAMARSCRGDQEVSNLCLAGGVAYNCVANSKIVERSGFEHVLRKHFMASSGVQTMGSPRMLNTTEPSSARCYAVAA